jgi:hypothetical protein
VPLGIWCFEDRNLAYANVCSPTNAPTHIVQSTTSIEQSVLLPTEENDEDSSLSIVDASSLPQQDSTPQLPPSSRPQEPEDGHLVAQVVQTNGSYSDYFNSSDPESTTDSPPATNLALLWLCHLREKNQPREPRPSSHWLKFGAAAAAGAAFHFIGNGEREQRRKRRRLSVSESESDTVDAPNPETVLPAQKIVCQKIDWQEVSISCKLFLPFS